MVNFLAMFDCRRATVLLGWYGFCSNFLGTLVDTIQQHNANVFVEPTIEDLESRIMISLVIDSHHHLIHLIHL